MKILRLQCECGRNLADTGDPLGLSVFPRSGVQQRRYQPGPNRATFTWHCKCGAIPQERSDRIASAWRDRVGDPQRVVVIVVGVDL